MSILKSLQSKKKKVKREERGKYGVKKKKMNRQGKNYKRKKVAESSKQTNIKTFHETLTGRVEKVPDDTKKRDLEAQV